MAVDRSLAERGAHGEFIALHDQAVRRGFLAAGVVLTLTLLAATVCASMARHFWLGELAVHFRVQYAALGMVGGRLSGSSGALSDVPSVFPGVETEAEAGSGCESGTVMLDEGPVGIGPKGTSSS